LIEFLGGRCGGEGFRARLDAKTAGLKDPRYV